MCIDHKSYFEGFNYISNVIFNSCLEMYDPTSVHDKFRKRSNYQIEKESEERKKYCILACLFYGSDELIKNCEPPFIRIGREDCRDLSFEARNIL